MKDLTQGSIPSTIVAMAAPVAMGMIFQTLYLLVDLYFVAGLGDAAIAGVGAAGTLFFMVMALSQVLGVSSVALMSQAVGRKDRDFANLVFNQSMVLAGIFTATTLFFGYTLSDSYMATIAAGDAQAEGIRFLHWFLPGMSMQFAIMGMSSALRATGIVKPTMMIQVITILLNTILAPTLIVGFGPAPALGVVGAGLATTFSSAVGVAMLIAYFVKLEKYVTFQFTLWKPQLSIWGRMVNIGLPAGGEMLLMFGYFAVVYWLIQDFGESAQAGFSVGGRIMQSIFMPIMAIAFAVGPIAGQNFGAGHGDRVREAFKQGILMSSAVMLVVTLILQFHPELLVAFFTDEEPVIKAGGDFLQIISWNFVAQGIIFTCSGMFQGLGNTKPAMFSSASRLVIFIPIAIWVSNQESFTMEKIWYVSVLSVTIQAVISFLLIRKEFSLKLSNLEAPSPAAPTTVEQQA